MRLVDCPNCFTSNSDDSLSSGSFVNRSGQRLRRLFRRRRAQCSNGGLTNDSPAIRDRVNKSSDQKLTNSHGWNGNASQRRYPIERKLVASKKRIPKGRQQSKKYKYYFSRWLLRKRINCSLLRQIQINIEGKI